MVVQIQTGFSFILFSLLLFTFFTFTFLPTSTPKVTSLLQRIDWLDFPSSLSLLSTSNHQSNLKLTPSRSKSKSENKDPNTGDLQTFNQAHLQQTGKKMRVSAPQISLSMLSPFSSASESGNLLQSPDSETPNSTPILSQSERKSKRVSSLGSMAIAMGFKSKQQPPPSNSTSQSINVKSKNGKNRALEAAANMLGLVNKQGSTSNHQESSTSLLSPTSPVSRRASVAIVSGQPLLSSVDRTINEDDEMTSSLDGSIPNSSSSKSSNLHYHHKPRLTVQPLLLKPAMQSCLKNAYRLSLPNGVGGGTSLVDQSQLLESSSTSIGVLPYPTPSIIFPSQNTLFQVGSGLSSSPSTSNVEVDPSIAHLDFRNHSQTILELDEQRRASDPDVKTAFEKELFEWLDTEGKGKSSRRSKKNSSSNNEDGLVGNSNSGQWSNQYDAQADGNESEMESQGYRADVDDFDSPCLGSEQYKRGSRIHTHATRRPMTGRRAAAEVGLGLESQEVIPKALKAPRFRGTVDEIVSRLPPPQEEEKGSLSPSTTQITKKPPSPPPRPSKSRARGVTLTATGAAAEFDYSFQSKDNHESPRTGTNPRKQKFSDPFASLDPFSSSSHNSPVQTSSGGGNLSSRARATSSPSLLQSSTFNSSHEPLCKNANQEGGSCCPNGSNHHGQVGRLHTRRPPGLQLTSLPKASLWAPVEIKANGGSLAGRNMRAPAVVDPRKLESEDSASQSDFKSKVKRSGSGERSSTGTGLGIGIGLGLGLRASDSTSKGITTEPLRPPRRRVSTVKSNTANDSKESTSIDLPAASSPSRNRSVSAVQFSSADPPIESPAKEVGLGLGFSPSTLSRARSVTMGAFARPKARTKELSPRLDDERFLKQSENADGKGIGSSLLGLSLALPLKGMNAPTDSSSIRDSNSKANKHTSLPARIPVSQIPAPVETPFLDLDGPHLDVGSKNAMQLWISETIKATKALGSVGQGRKVVEAPATGRSNVSTSLFSPNPWNKKQLSTTIAEQTGMMRWDLEGTSTSSSSNPSEAQLEKEDSPAIRLIPIKLVQSFKSPSEASENENSLLVPVKSPVIPTIKGASSSPSYQLAPPSCAITLNSSSSDESPAALLLKHDWAQPQVAVNKVPLTERERRNASSVIPPGSNHGKEADWFKSTPSPLMMPAKFKSYSSSSPNPTADLAKSLGLCHLVSPEGQQKKASSSPQLGVSSPRLGSPHPLRQASRFRDSDSEGEEVLSEGNEKARPDLTRMTSISSSIDSRDGLLGDSRSNMNSLSPSLKSRPRNKAQRRPLTAPSRTPSSSRIHPADYPPLLSRRDSCSSVGSVRMVREGSSSSFGSFMGGNEMEPSSPSTSLNAQAFQGPRSLLQRQTSSPLISFPSPLSMQQIQSREEKGNIQLNTKFDTPLLINLTSPVFSEEVAERRRDNLGLSLTRSIPLHIDVSASTVSSNDRELCSPQDGEDSSASSSSNSSQASPTKEPNGNDLKPNLIFNRSLSQTGSKKVNSNPVQLIENALEEKLFFSAISRARLASRVATPFSSGLQLGEGMEDGEEEVMESKCQVQNESAFLLPVNSSIQNDLSTPFSEEGAASILSGTTAC